MEMEENPPPTKTSPLELYLQPKGEDWRRTVGAILSKLALHYWRADFTPEQAKMLLADFYDDLGKFTPAEIQTACARWRRNPENRFFPTPGGLLGLLTPKSDPPHHLKLYRAPPALSPPRATKSVADVLRENGYIVQAKSWATR